MSVPCSIVSGKSTRWGHYRAPMVVIKVCRRVFAFAFVVSKVLSLRIDGRSSHARHVGQVLGGVQILKGVPPFSYRLETCSGLLLQRYTARCNKRSAFRSVRNYERRYTFKVEI